MNPTRPFGHEPVETSLKQCRPGNVIVFKLLNHYNFSERKKTNRAKTSTEKGDF